MTSTPQQLIKQWQERAADCERIFLRPQAMLWRRAAVELEEALAGATLEAASNVSSFSARKRDD